MKKNYKAALLRAQMGGRLPKAQHTNIEGFSPAQSTCPTCPNYVNPEDVYTQQGINRGPRPGWTDSSLPCKGMTCPQHQVMDPNTCTCIDPPPVTYPGGRNPDAIYKKGGQYSPNMNAALKSFKKGGSTKK